MKTLKLAASLLLLVTLFYSCTTEEYYTEDDNGYHESWYTENVTISKNEWKLKGDVDGIGSYYECVVYFKDLDSQYFREDDVYPYRDGILNVYRYLNYKTGYET